MWAPEGLVLRCAEDAVEKKWLECDEYKKWAQLLGFVVEKSDVLTIRIELIRDDVSLAEGQLLTVQIEGQNVLYQIINGITESEILEQANKHGFVNIEARKLGRWNGSEQRFQQVAWVPQIYSPVYLVKSAQREFDKQCVGYIPNTDYGITVSCKEMVTHNTAILGVLGVGKTSLALELIKRMVSEGIKVWVVDITSEYEPALGKLVHSSKQNKANGDIVGAIAASAEIHHRDKSSGGNHKKFSEAVKAHIKQFMDDGTWMVRVFNPYDFRVTEQTTFDRPGMTSDQHGYADLTITEKTRIVSEQLLEFVKDEMSDEPRLCLVLEEAHSIVPEWNSVAYDGDKTATSGTAKAILQGRKYGFGCLLITQRTANVTKSILNQCNTIFGLRVFDATGMEFLKNYVGSDYAGLLSTLPDRYCVSYGKALNTQSPIVIELNERAKFNREFEIPDEYFETDEPEVVTEPDQDTQFSDFSPPDDLGDIPF